MIENQYRQSVKALCDKRRFYIILGDSERDLSTVELGRMGIRRQNFPPVRGYPVQRAGLTSIRSTSSKEGPNERGHHYVTGTLKHIEGLTKLLDAEGFKHNT